jgi:quercetin dioxygenase-like cupin family protein
MERANRDRAKGWYLGAWNSELALAIGYAWEGINDPHLHRRITEIYLVGAGTAELRVEQETFQLEAGDVVVIEPGEAHTFLASSPEYFHFVLHVPSLPPDDMAAEREPVRASCLGL